MECFSLEVRYFFLLGWELMGCSAVLGSGRSALQVVCLYWLSLMVLPSFLCSCLLGGLPLSSWVWVMLPSRCVRVCERGLGVYPSLSPSHSSVFFPLGGGWASNVIRVLLGEGL